VELSGSFTNTIDRIWEKLKGWGDKFLSIKGKAILIKAVIQSIPSYAISLFRLPKGLTSEIKRLCARFWWGSDHKNRKIHMRTWSRLCKPKIEGGLGFRDFETFNRTLLAEQ
ncbi:hypothetical protein Dsin_008229, partial [Dipteronia sinensis]